MTAFRRLRLLATSCALAVALAPVPRAHSQAPPACTCCHTQLRAYADTLYADLEYYRAITEYRRYLSYFPYGTDRDHAHMRIVEAYLFGEHYADALHWAQGIAESTSSPLLAARARLAMAHALIRLDNLTRARDVAAQSVAAPDPDIQARAHYAIALSFVRAGEWGSAIDRFASIPPGNSLRSQTEAAQCIVARQQTIPDKRPGLAALLNLLPGLGYAYIDRPQTAIAAAIVNALGALATYSAFANDQPAFGATLGVISVGWYTGGIYGARVGAMRANQDRRIRVFESVYRY